MSTRAAAMCDLCQMTGTVETDVSKPEAIASALAWAVHFLDQHPEITSRTSDHVILVEEPAQSEGSES